MKSKLNVIVMAIMVTAFLVAAGCASKKTASTPPGATPVVTEKTQVESTPIDDGQQVDEAALAAEAQARQKAEAVKELTNVVIHFDFDSYELSEEARALLAMKADILRHYAGVRVVIEGHCDERGTEEYNLALGERRARAAYEHLVILGVNPERMSLVSFGEEKPVDTGHFEKAWMKNRRAEFVVQ